MSDDQRGYREGRPLAEIIPPDRRRAKAIGLVLGGMFAGALMLVVVQRLAARSATQRAPVVERFTAGAERDEFELVVDGPVIGIVVAQHEASGLHMPASVRWATLDYNPSEPERWRLGLPSDGHAKLAVLEGSRRLDDPLGGMTSLGAGKHRLTLHLTSRDEFTSGAFLRAYVIGPGKDVSTSEILHVMGHPPEPRPLPAPYVPDPAPVPGPPFDRGAAAATLGALRFDHCAKLAGATPTGRFEVTFAPDGTVASAQVTEGVDPSAPAAQCIADTVKKKARIPAFGGSPVHVKKSFTLPIQQ